jgi:hypothetical protein
MLNCSGCDMVLLVELPKVDPSAPRISNLLSQKRRNEVRRTAIPTHPGPAGAGNDASGGLRCHRRHPQAQYS